MENWNPGKANSADIILQYLSRKLLQKAFIVSRILFGCMIVLIKAFIHSTLTGSNLHDYAGGSGNSDISMEKEK